MQCRRPVIEAWLIVAWLAALLLGPPGMAGAAEVSAADRSEIQAVIGRQVEAFRQDDAALAFGLAAPTIQAQFGTAENFLAMVRTAYPAVYRPRRFEFRELIDLDGVPAQTVLVVGPDGRPKLAIYPMERLQTGEWRIGGCYLVELPGTDT